MRQMYWLDALAFLPLMVLAVIISYKIITKDGDFPGASFLGAFLGLFIFGILFFVFGLITSIPQIGCALGATWTEIRQERLKENTVSCPDGFVLTSGRHSSYYCAKKLNKCEEN